MIRIKTGDIFEINTPMGKAYLHYIYKDKLAGDLIRILPGLYPERPDILYKIVIQKEKYMVFFPLGAAHKKSIVELLGNYPAHDYQKPQYMRTEHSIRNEFLGWHIVNTDSLKRDLKKTLSSEEKKLSPWGIWNDTLLIENLTKDWSLDDWY